MQSLRNDWGVLGFVIFLALMLSAAGCYSSSSEPIIPHANDRSIDGVIENVEYHEEDLSKVVISYEDGGVISLRIQYSEPPLFPLGQYSRLWYQGNNNIITGVERTNPPATTEEQPERDQM